MTKSNFFQQDTKGGQKGADPTGEGARPVPPKALAGKDPNKTFRNTCPVI
jgi:hypothetical protein